MSNIPFESIPASIRKPGVYSEFNLNAARMALPENSTSVLILAQGLAAGSVDQKIPTKVFSDAEASAYFGAGSQAHLMAAAAFKANPNIDLTIATIDDAGAGVAATGTITIANAATSAGVLTVRIGDVAITVPIANTDAATAVATALNTAIGLKAHLLPVTAGVADAVVTLTARNKGTLGNQIPVEASCTASGTTAAVVAMASGATDPDIGAASGLLDAVFAGEYAVIVSAWTDATTLADIKDHLESISGPTEQRPALGVFSGNSLTGNAAAMKTLCGTTLNHWRLTCAYLPGTSSMPYEIAAAYGAVIASEADPAMPLNNLSLKGINAPAVDDRLSRTEQEDFLSNGVTPLHVIPGELVGIVRAITTYTKNAQAIADATRLDITTPRSLDYMRASCIGRISTKFGRVKKTERVKKAVRSELLAVLYMLEGMEIVENLDTWADYLVIEDDAQDLTRVNARIPAPIVRGLHVIAQRIDLL